MNKNKCTIRIRKNSVIYVLCPGDLVTGGPDALHQLVYYLTKLGYNAKISYYGNEKATCPELYKKYSPSVTPLCDIPDERQNVVVCPESSTYLLERYNRAQKCVWWLSYGYYDNAKVLKMPFKVKFKNAVKHILNLFLPKNKKFIYSKNKKERNRAYVDGSTINLCGSKYAYTQIERNHKHIRKKAMFVEPLSPEFLREEYVPLTSKGRSDAVLYNPSKPSDVMERLLKRDDISFLPLKGYSPEELISLFNKSKLYIDFGNFGGPERLPKESVLNGTLLLVGKRGAAVNDFDVAIPDKYKVENYDDDEAVAQRIKYMLANYDELIADFAPFRKKIQNLEKEFLKEIAEIFVRV